MNSDTKVFLMSVSKYLGAWAFGWLVMTALGLLLTSEVLFALFVILLFMPYIGWKVWVDGGKLYNVLKAKYAASKNQS